MPSTQQKLTVGSRLVDLSVWTPSTGTARHAVVVAYGTSGMTAPFGKMITDFCRAVSEAGYLVLLPDYFQSTGSQAGLEVVYSSEAEYAQWIETLTIAANEAQRIVPAGKIAFAGFSLGGNLALNAALKFPAACVVDYFAPISRFTLLSMHASVRITEARAKKLPATLIHHGNSDLFVLPAQSQQVADWSAKNGVPECTLYSDYNCGHPGQPIGVPWTDKTDKATTRTLAFLKKRFR